MQTHPCVVTRPENRFQRRRRCASASLNFFRSLCVAETRSFSIKEIRDLEMRDSLASFSSANPLSLRALFGQFIKFPPIDWYFMLALCMQRLLTKSLSKHLFWGEIIIWRAAGIVKKEIEKSGLRGIFYSFESLPSSLRTRVRIKRHFAGFVCGRQGKIPKAISENRVR